MTALSEIDRRKSSIDRTSLNSIISGKAMLEDLSIILISSDVFFLNYALVVYLRNHYHLPHEPTFINSFWASEMKNARCNFHLAISYTFKNNLCEYLLMHEVYVNENVLLAKPY
jgi:hypothetical protein